MNLKTKITLGYVALLALLLALGGYAYYSVHRLEAASRNILRANFYSVELGQRMLRALDRLERAPADSSGLAAFQRSLTREAGNITEVGEQRVVDELTQTLGTYQTRRDERAPADVQRAVIYQLRDQTQRMMTLNTRALVQKNDRTNARATQAGRYRARLTQGDCVALTAAVEVRAIIATTYVIPNIFTPNGDGLNEEFALRLSAPRTSEIQIFNRWGREVFHTSQYGEFWTGAGSPVGVYYYVWRYSTDCDATEHTVRGIVTLAR